MIGFVHGPILLFYYFKTVNWDRVQTHTLVDSTDTWDRMTRRCFCR